MRFEWDAAKRSSNIRRRGLDFADAHKVFLRPVLRALDQRTDYGEDRWIGIGMLDEIRTVVLVFTEPNEDTIRIISMRKAMAHERQRYQRVFRDRFGPI